MSGVLSLLKPDLGKLVYLALGALVVPRIIGRLR